MSIRGVGPTDNPYENLRIREDADAGRAEGRGKAAGKPTPSGDGVSVSSDAKLLAAGFEAARKAPDVREDKVARLKELVASGQYQVDGRSIAERMVREDVEDLD
ncbi:MAG: flagellar biosynthesis anti-sigma factor FlgM [Thermodesulfobacteriota bacterium]